MYQHNEKQLRFENFSMPFGGHLRSDNRWVRLAKLVPWDEIETIYTSTLSGTSQGAPALSARVAFGALIIKERLGTSDEETVEQIRENPYLQYFLGLNEYSHDRIFHSTMFVHFRKRFPAQAFKKVNDLIAKKAMDATTKKTEDDESDKDDSNTQDNGKVNKGKLIVDATCAPEDITYPTDLKLLNKAREESELIIDILHKKMPARSKKPRTYRIKARKNYLQVSKSRRASKKNIRKAIRKQLGYLARNLKSIAKQNDQVCLTNLDKRQYKTLLVISELYRQQKWMYDQRSRRIDDRIVSINKPHVRPIKRGKAGADTEFGAKISASLVNGYIFADRISWNNFNESTDLVDQIETYKSRTGFYPESVHSDKIYRNRKNIRYCKKHGIRLSGPRLGRPPKQIETNKEQLQAAKQLARQDELDRISIEGKFGQSKRRFSLSRIMTKLSCTSETSIILTFIVVNLEKWLKAILLFLFSKGEIPRRFVISTKFFSMNDSVLYEV
jgi:hypothetical protein